MTRNHSEEFLIIVAKRFFLLGIDEKDGHHFSVTLHWLAKDQLLRLWALLDELEDVLRTTRYHDLMDAINRTRRKIVDDMSRPIYSA